MIQTDRSQVPMAVNESTVTPNQEKLSRTHAEPLLITLSPPAPGPLSQEQCESCAALQEKIRIAVGNLLG